MAEPGAAGVGPAEGSAGVGEGGAAEGGEGVAPPPKLLFSEYVEGSGTSKALEIVALEGGSLVGCELLTYFNGKMEPTKLALKGDLATGETQVLCSSSLAESGMAACSRPTNLSFNGDDALALVCQGTVQDIFGEIGVDPGESWGEGATLDHTLQRRCEVLTGRTEPTSPFDVDVEWTKAEALTFADLGQRSCEPVSRSTR